MRMLIVMTLTIGACAAEPIAYRPVSTEPRGAYVYADGRLVGRSPTDVPGYQVVMVYLPGYVPRVVTGDGPMRLEPAVRPPTSASPTSWTPERQRAWTLVKLAVAAAERGDCAAVAAFGTEVRALDPQLYEHLFAREVALDGCVP